MYRTRSLLFSKLSYVTSKVTSLFADCKVHPPLPPPPFEASQARQTNARFTLFSLEEFPHSRLFLVLPLRSIIIRNKVKHFSLKISLNALISVSSNVYFLAATLLTARFKISITYPWIIEFFVRAPPPPTNVYETQIAVRCAHTNLISRLP